MGKVILKCFGLVLLGATACYAADTLESSNALVEISRPQ